MEIYCSKCRKKTASTNLEKVKTANNKWRMKAICKVCKHEKSTFIKAPEASEVVKETKILSTKETIQEAKELHTQVIKKFPKRKIVTLGIDDLWAADLVIMEKYSSDNDGYKYLLNVIDTFSKYVWAEPLTRKSGKEVTSAFRIIIKRALSVGHKSPNLLHTDKGGEFVNKELSALLKEYKIKLYHTQNEEKSAIIERFNRTLNHKMKVQFEIRKSFRWVDLLQGILREYNNSFHRTIGMKPKEVNKDNEGELRKMYGLTKINDKNPKFKIGDRVRITVKKETFENKYRNNWTREIFVITEVKNTVPITYAIKDLNGEEITGSFYEQELQKSKSK